MRSKRITKKKIPYKDQINILCQKMIEPLIPKAVEIHEHTIYVTKAPISITRELIFRTNLILHQSDINMVTTEPLNNLYGDNCREEPQRCQQDNWVRNKVKIITPKQLEEKIKKEQLQIKDRELLLKPLRSSSGNDKRSSKFGKMDLKNMERQTPRAVEIDFQAEDSEIAEESKLLF